jgi:anti-sigma regulatory factor (Ser/Thr protein kinase)
MPNTLPIDKLAVEGNDRETNYIFKIVEPVKGTFDSVHSIVERVAQDLKKAGLADLVDSFETCIIEAIENATKYAYAHDAEATVDFQYYRADKQIKLSIRDFGAGFDYKAFKKRRIVSPEDAISKNNEAYRRYGKNYPNTKGELGLLMMEMFMDQVEYENNTLLMIKKIEPKPDPDSSSE